MGTKNKAITLDDEEESSMSTRNIAVILEIEQKEEQKVEQKEERHTIGVKRSWSVYEASDWITRDEILTSGPCAENAERQFEMLYATVYCATMPKLGGLAPTLAVAIMRYIIPECGCYIESWEQRWSEWDILPDLSAQCLINCMTLNRLHALPYFRRHLDAASLAFSHPHDDPDTPYRHDNRVRKWQPMGGQILYSDEEGDEGHEEDDEEEL